MPKAAPFWAAFGRVENYGSYFDGIGVSVETPKLANIGACG